MLCAMFGLKWVCGTEGDKYVKNFIDGQMDLKM